MRAIRLPANGHFNGENPNHPCFGFRTSGAGVRFEIGTPAEAKPVRSRSKPGARPVPTGFAPALHRLCTGFGSHHDPAHHHPEEGAEPHETRTPLLGMDQISVTRLESYLLPKCVACGSLLASTKCATKSSLNMSKLQ
jgi:hypothetical protein